MVTKAYLVSEIQRKKTLADWHREQDEIEAENRYTGDIIDDVQYIPDFEDNTPPNSPPRKKRKFEVLKFDDPGSDVVLWNPQYSRKGKVKCPKNLENYLAKSYMLVIWSTPLLMMQLLETMRGQQQKFFESIKNFRGSLFQGEYSEKNLAHLQGVMYFKSVVRSSAIFKLFAPYLTETFGFQIKKTASLKDAWHYCAKPHNNCECVQCEKARLCKPNWSGVCVCGEVPVGRGKKFAAFEIAMKEDPSKTNMIENYGSLYYRYHGGMDKIRRHYEFKKNCKEYNIKGLDFLSNFQLALVIDLVYNVNPKENRAIYWFWSDKLKTGKSLMGAFAKLLLGPENCMDGIRSYKHYITAYDGESLTHFNFAKAAPPKTHHLELLEMCDDGGVKQAGMYKGEKRFVYTRVMVTANVPPPKIWTEEEGKRVLLTCRMRENEDDPYEVPEYNQDEIVVEF